MSWRWLLPCFGLLAACGSTPPLAPPLLAARDLAEQAGRAAQAGNWRAAAADWHEVARQYAALDDWLDAGRASLGEAQALERSGRQQESLAVLDSLESGRRYSPTIRAEARYQQALMEITSGSFEVARTHLQEASASLPPGDTLQAAIANARARMGAIRADWADVARWSATALTVGAISPVERANAHRLAGESALATGNLAQADVHVGSALALDRQLAHAQAIAADLGLMARLARLRGDEDAVIWAERAQAACAAVGSNGCDPLAGSPLP